MNKDYEAERDAAIKSAEMALLNFKECTCENPEYGQCPYHDQFYDLHFGFSKGADWSRERLLGELGEVKEALEAIRKNIYSTPPQLTAKRALTILKRLGVK